MRRNGTPRPDVHRAAREEARRRIYRCEGCLGQIDTGDRDAQIPREDEYTVGERLAFCGECARENAAERERDAGEDAADEMRAEHEADDLADNFDDGD